MLRTFLIAALGIGLLLLLSFKIQMFRRRFFTNDPDKHDRAIDQCGLCQTESSCAQRRRLDENTVEIRIERHSGTDCRNPEAMDGTRQLDALNFESRQSTRRNDTENQQHHGSMKG